VYERHRPTAVVTERQSIKPYSTAKSELTGHKSRDPILFNARSFNVCFGSKGQFYFSSGTKIQTWEVTQLDTRLLADHEYAEKQFIPELTVSINNSNCHVQVNHELPTFTLRRDALPDVITQYIDAVNIGLSSENLSASTRATLKHKETVWRLLYALISRQEDVNETKRLVSHWLRESVKETIEKELEALEKRKDLSYNDKILKHIFILLTGNQITRATDIALANKNYSLATIISQYSVDSVKIDLKKQIETWRDREHNSAISQILLEIYRLLSGDVQVPSANDLDWKRKLGLYLWYKFEPNELLTRVFDDYSKNKDMNSDADGDINYYILRLFAGKHSQRSTLSDLLPPSKHTNDHLDYRLSWHVYLLLLNHFSESLQSHQLHVNYAFQLELVGLWQWAIYVLMHLEEELEHTARQKERAYLETHEEQRKRLAMNRVDAIKHILSRYIDTCDSSVEKFLLETLNIPARWIHEARALKNMYDRDYIQLANNLISCGNYEEAHTLVVETLAPVAILNDVKVVLKKLLDTLAVHQQKLRGWETRGYIYYNYLDNEQEYNYVIDYLHKNSEYIEPDKLLKAIDALYSAYKETAENIPKLVTSYDLHNRPQSEQNTLISICIQDMSAFVSKVLVEIAQLRGSFNQDRPDFSSILSAADVVNLLAVPQSHRIDQLQQLCYDLLNSQ
jgi:hypothetical protein